MKAWLNSVRHALNGVILFFKTERNARIEGIAALLVLFLSFILHLSIVEWCLILFCIGSVLSAEAFNSAIERLADFQTQEKHPSIKAIKDIAAGAVLMLAIVSICIGLFVFFPKLFPNIL